MKSTLKSDQHCELHDSVNHLKVERMNAYFFFGLFLKSCFLSVIVCGCGCGCVGVWLWAWVLVWVGCVYECVCVDGFNMDVLVRVHGCVSLLFLHFIFRVFCFVFLFFSRFVLVFFS